MLQRLTAFGVVVVAVAVTVAQVVTIAAPISNPATTPYRRQPQRLGAIDVDESSLQRRRDGGTSQSNGAVAGTVRRRSHRLTAGEQQGACSDRGTSYRARVTPSRSRSREAVTQPYCRRCSLSSSRRPLVAHPHPSSTRNAPTVDRSEDIWDPIP